MESSASPPPVADLGRRAKAASRILATASTPAKDAALEAAADLLVRRTEEILSANASDVARAEESGTPAKLLTRWARTASKKQGSTTERSVSSSEAPAVRWLLSTDSP